MEYDIQKNKQNKALSIGIVMWRLLIVLLIIPCLITDIVGLIPMLILTKMDKDNSPFPYIQYLIELW